MNALIRLWNVLASLGDSLERTRDLVDTGNARLEQSLGLDRPQVKLIDVSPAAGSDGSASEVEDGKKRRPVKTAAA